MTAEEHNRVPGLVDHLFRRSAGRMIATLTRHLGPDQLELAEEVVQEAMLKALQVWPMRGVPDNPGGWLYSVARNAAIDRLRRNRSVGGGLDQLPSTATPPPVDLSNGSPIVDDELCMIFMCCHPALPVESQVALTLKTVGGFSVGEIARACLAQPPTIAQRLVRAKRLLRNRGVRFEIPPANQLPGRLAAVSNVLYLMFNEGYAAFQGEELIRTDLCREAIRLASLLLDSPTVARPELHALLALMYFQASRLPARLDGAGAVVLLPHQDRSLWDRAAIAQGFRHLEAAANGPTVTAFHLEAGVAACHAAANSYDATDWDRVLQLYDRLVDVTPSPVARLNRSVAVAMVRGPQAGIAALDPIRDDTTLRAYYLLPATLGEFYDRLGDYETAAAWFRRAVECPCSAPEKRFLRRRVADCEARHA